jgi:hypothetical protein
MMALINRLLPFVRAKIILRLLLSMCAAPENKRVHPPFYYDAYLNQKLAPFQQSGNYYFGYRGSLMFHDHEVLSWPKPHPSPKMARPSNAKMTTSSSLATIIPVPSRRGRPKIVVAISMQSAHQFLTHIESDVRCIYENNLR